MIGFTPSILRRLFAIAIVLFVFFVVWIFLNEDIGSNPAIRRV
jgi:ABC-type uncharacterized transport system permease subunit